MQPLPFYILQESSAIDCADGKYRLRSIGVLAQHFFHPDHIVPSAEFVAALVKGTHRSITHVRMEFGAVVV